MTVAAHSLAHQAFVYGSSEEFVAEMAPFIREGLDRGDAVFAAAKPANVTALREELGADAARAVLVDATRWCTRPYERLQAFRRMVDELPPGRSLRALGEPVWEGSDAVVRQWARYESIINLALADAPMRFICLYDGAGLPQPILDYAGRTHPEQITGAGSVAPCEHFVAPHAFVPGQPATPPASPAELPLRGSGLRRALAEHARAAGMRPERADDFVLAANEVATNALIHGRPPVAVQVWHDGCELVCQVSDGGPGIEDPLAGWLPPTRKTGGWGLAIARQVCDAVDVAAGPAGSAVSLHMSL